MVQPEQTNSLSSIIIMCSTEDGRDYNTDNIPVLPPVCCLSQTFGYRIPSSSSFIILLLWRSVKPDRKPRLRYFILIQHLLLKGNFVRIMTRSLRHGCSLKIKTYFFLKLFSTNHPMLLQNTAGKYMEPNDSDFFFFTMLIRYWGNFLSNGLPLNPWTHLRISL